MHPTRLRLSAPLFSIAGFEFSIQGGTQFAAISQSWRAFARPDAAPALMLEVELTPPVARPADWQPLLPAIRSEPDGALLLEGDGFQSRIAADRRSGWVRGPPEPFPVEAVVRVLLGEWLLRRGGLLVHAVALAHHRRAALFTGFSGAGKSTLGCWGSAGGLTLLSDELVAVLPEGEGFAAHGTPWNTGQPGQASLKQLGLLAHAKTPELSPLPASEVLRVLLSNVLEPADSVPVRSALFQIASRLLTVVPAVRLAFAPEPGVARVIAQALAAS